MRSSLFALLLAACGGASSTSQPTAAPAVPPAADPCAGDAPWLVAILGDLPTKSDYVSPEHGLRDPDLGPVIARGEGRDVDGNSSWLKNVSWSSQEIYEYDGRPTQKVVVARNVTGKDPRTLGDFGQPPALGAPSQLPSGVVEWPSALPSKSDGQFLYVFPDRTWVIVETWMAPRFHAIFASSAQSPPMPSNPPDTYVEYCFPRLRPTQIDSQKAEGIDLAGAEHFAMRFKAGQIRSPEIALTYPTPAEAQRAEAAEREQCARNPCKISASRVEGRVARFLFGAAKAR